MPFIENILNWGSRSPSNRMIKQNIKTQLITNHRCYRITPGVFWLDDSKSDAHLFNRTVLKSFKRHTLNKFWS